MSTSGTSPSHEYLTRLLSRMNHTECYQLARRAGHAVLPSYSREALIEVLVREFAPEPDGDHVFDEWRYAIMRFLQQHRRSLETQIACPAKSFELTACFGCVDAQVARCLIDNRTKLHLIQLHRKKTHD